MKIAILGAGAFGTALGGVLVENGHDISYYDPKIEKSVLSDVISNSEMILITVPSIVVPHLLPKLPKNEPLIVATKGIISDKVFQKFRDYMIISGPGFADDIKKHQITKLTITDKRLDKLFKRDYMEFDYTDDRKGVLMCGALKNVYALYAGMKGLERDTGEMKKFIVNVSTEMKGVLVANDAKSSTVDCYCGVSDLVLTCGYPSRNYEFGDMLRKKIHHKSDKTIESISVLKRIRRREIMVPKEAKLLNEILDLSKNFA